MDFVTHSFPGDENNYVAPSWVDLQRLTFAIAKQIHAGGQKFDRIITLAKGGWPMTRCLIDFLEIEEVASIGVKFYSGINERFERPIIYQDLPVSVKAERVLLFDDVADTGASLEYTQHYLFKYRSVAEVTTATLILKPHSTITPDFYGAETAAWVIFPYDVADLIAVLRQKWLTQDVAEAEIAERFLQLGFQPQWIDFFLKKKV